MSLQNPQIWSSWFSAEETIFSFVKRALVISKPNWCTKYVWKSKCLGQENLNFVQNPRDLFEIISLYLPLTKQDWQFNFMQHLFGQKMNEMLLLTTSSSAFSTFQKISVLPVSYKYELRSYWNLWALSANVGILVRPYKYTYEFITREILTTNLFTFWFLAYLCSQV